jgi:proteasome lid subunit RPN8/RPN11
MDLSRVAPRVRISPPEEIAPAPGKIPSAHAVRWWSPYEGAGREPYLAVFMTARAYIRCCAHAGSDLEHEVGGGLVGGWRRDRATGRPFIVIEAALPARHTRQGRSFVTFTQDSLVELHEELEARYPRKLLVGWYHTHPGMDIFLSGYDLWLHEHFFPYSWQVALVIEPQERHGGFFVRRPDGQPDPRHYTGFSELVRPSTQPAPSTVEGLRTGPAAVLGTNPSMPSRAARRTALRKPTFPESQGFRKGDRSVVNWANLRTDGARPAADGPVLPEGHRDGVSVAEGGTTS